MGYLIGYHGTINASANRIVCDGIDRSSGNGALDKGFYISLNPVEALDYGTRKGANGYKDIALVGVYFDRPFGLIPILVVDAYGRDLTPEELEFKGMLVWRNGNKTEFKINPSYIEYFWAEKISKPIPYRIIAPLFEVQGQVDLSSVFSNTTYFDSKPNDLSNLYHRPQGSEYQGKPSPDLSKRTRRSSFSYY